MATMPLFSMLVSPLRTPHVGADCGSDHRSRLHASFSRFLCILGVLGGFFLSTACGDSDTGRPTDVGVTPDTGDTSPDGSDPSDTGEDVDQDAVDTDSSPPPDVTPDVPPAQPVALEVRIVPGRALYTPGLMVEVRATLYAPDGREISGPAPTVTVTPATGATASADRWRLEEEGRITFEACVPIAPTEQNPGGTLCGQRDVVVDGGRPTLEILNPMPGAELTFVEARGVVIRGRVDDTHGPVVVYLDGRPVEVADDGTFSAPFVPAWGINHIDVVATDRLHAIETRAGVDVMVAERFVPYAPTAESPIAATFDNALLLQISQRFLDANLAERVNFDTDPIRTTDLASILDLLLREVELGGVLPDPIVDDSALRLRVTGIRPGAPQFDIISTVRGVEIYVDLPDIQVDTLGSATVGGQTLNLDGGVRASVSAFVRMRLRQRPTDDALDVAVEEIDLAVESLVGRFASAQANAIVAVVGSGLFSAIEGAVLQAVREGFLDELPTLLAGAFGEIEGLLSDQTFPLDLGFGTPITLSLDAELDTLTPANRKGLTAELDVTTSTDAAVQFPTSRGIPVAVAPNTRPTLLQTARVQIAVSMELVNGLFHQLWNSGLLEIDASSQIPSGLAVLIDRARISGRLSPHLRAARPGESEFPLLLTLGQVELTIGRGPNEDILGMYVVAGLDAQIEGSRLVLNVQSPPSIRLWEINTGGSAPLFENVRSLEELVTNVVWPQLAGSLTEDLAIELPVLDLSGLGDIAPSLSAFTLAVTLDRDLEIRDGHLLISGGLDGEVSLP